MRNLIDITNTLSTQKEYLAKKYGVSSLAVFGSYSTGNQREDSDIDLLVDFDRPVGIEYIYLASELEKLLNMKVDLITRNGVKPRYLKSIEKNLLYV